MIPKTIIAVAALSAVTLTAGLGSLYYSPNEAEREAKKAALEENKFSSAQMPLAAQCYDNLTEISANANRMEIGKTCKCLIREIEKYAPPLQPALQRLMLIGLDASVQTSDAQERASYISVAYSKDQILQNVSAEHQQLLRSGISHVINSCPLPQD